MGEQITRPLPCVNHVKAFFRGFQALAAPAQEALPVSENSAIRIELSPQMTPPTVKNADDRRGVAVWTYDLAPGEVKDIRFGYRVTWPWGESITLD